MKKMIQGSRRDDTLHGTRHSDDIHGNRGDDKLIGHRGDDVIRGGKGDDRIFGGQGLDALTGSAGKDRFVFNSLLAQDADVVVDFTPGVDRIVLDTLVFDEYSGRGQIDSGSFVVGTAALDGDDHLIYDPATGGLFYDEDGSGSGEQVLLASLENMADLSAADIFTF